MKYYMAFNHNKTPLLLKPASKVKAEREAADYRWATENPAYVEEVSKDWVEPRLKEKTPPVMAGALDRRVEPSSATSEGDEDLKGREDRVRRLLRRQGLALRKSRYGPARLGHGGYMILDPATNVWSHGALPNPYSLSLEDVERIAGVGE